MKKMLFPSVLIIFSLSAYSQSGQKFSTGLNSLSGTDALGSSNNFPLIIKTNSTEWMRITETGNVGIGIVAPVDKLHIAGTARMLNANIDNLMQALSVSAQSANFATAIVTGEITAGSLVVNGNATVDGALSVTGNSTLGGTTTLHNAAITGQLTTSSITSSSGNIDFGNNNLSTTGNFSAADITASGTLNAQTIL